MSEGNDHNTSAGDKYSLPLLCEVNHDALCKVKADTVAKVLGLGTQCAWLSRGNIEDKSQKVVVVFEGFPGVSNIDKSQRELSELRAGSGGEQWLDLTIDN